MIATQKTISQKVVKLFLLSALMLLATLGAFVPQALASTYTLHIPVEQRFTLGQGALHSGTFNYEITRLSSNYPLPSGATGDSYTFSITGNEVVPVSIAFDRVGLFQYEIRCANTPGEGLTLDDTVYTVVVIVRNAQNGGFVATIQSITSSATGEKGYDIIFEKALASPLESDATPNSPIVKTVQGNPSQAYSFTFRLEAQGDFPMPTGATGRTLDITIAGSGRAYFGTWTYSQAGIYTYLVREIPSNNSDYVFDTSVFTITDTVENTDGQLTVDRVITNADNRQVSSLDFINTYVGTDIEIQESPPATQTPIIPTPPGTTITGPKTGDYADPIAMIVAMAISFVIAIFALILIYMDRKSEKEYGATTT